MRPAARRRRCEFEEGEVLECRAGHWRTEERTELRLIEDIRNTRQAEMTWLQGDNVRNLRVSVPVSL
jgi:hypothetical protein